MPHLVDGHNLIPKIGLRLDSVDDEMELIEILQKYSRETRISIEVFFDGAPAGQAGSRKFGRVTAVFVSQTSTADAAIRERLRRLRGEARNWTVVSSDREVQSAAKAARARTKTADEYALEVRTSRGRGGKSEQVRGARGPAGGVSDAEVQDWLDIFRKRK